jgi:hypothetical protein
MPGSGITAQEQTVRIAGSVVRLSAKAFASLAGRGVGRRGWQYLAVSRGVVFHATSKSQLSLPRTIKCIEAEDIWVSFLGPKKG